MKAIFTRYVGPGNVRGSRIIADDHDGNRVTLPWRCDMSDDKNHDAAALALCHKMAWYGKLVRGGNAKGGNVYVWEGSWARIAVAAPTDHASAKGEQ